MKELEAMRKSLEGAGNEENIRKAAYERALAEGHEATSKLQKSLDSANNRAAAADKEHAKALQELANQIAFMKDCMDTVKITVMIPRVTLSVKDQTLEFGSGLKLPKAKIKKVLEEEMLPKYLKIFAQQNDPSQSAAAGGGNVPWLESYMNEIVDKIETKIRSLLMDDNKGGQKR